MPPKPTGNLQNDPTFTAEERLFRRILETHLKPSGEVDPVLINSTTTFDKKCKQKTPSVVREKYASKDDALHPNCADGKSTAGQRVYACKVGALPKNLASDNGSMYDFIPIHDPLPECYAHSLIRSILAGTDPDQYAPPPKVVRRDFRQKFAAALSPA
jgi:hypothetical protein